MAFDVGQNLNEANRINLRNQAYNSGIWAYTEPIIYTPRWVHFDNRWVQSGYPIIKQGSRGPYVCIAQDCLNNLGLTTGGLDGVFGNQTKNAIETYQRTRNLTIDGIVGTNTWNKLMNEVVGTGKTNSTIN